MRRGYQEQDAKGYMTFDELGAALEGLEETRQTAERELAALQNRREAIEALERDKDALLDHYASIAPEALNSLTHEERHQLYRMLQLSVSVYPDSTLEVSGVFGRACSLVNWSSYRGTNSELLNLPSWSSAPLGPRTILKRCASSGWPSGVSVIHEVVCLCTTMTSGA
jgi:hypothetical protein